MTAIGTLHILNKPPGHPAFKLCLGSMAPEDTLLLTENGVVALADRETELPARIYALAPDMKARAIAEPEAGANAIDYDGMVALTIEADRVISW